MTDTNDRKECCAKFESDVWDGKTHVWINKPFITESMPTFFHIPFPPMIGKMVWRMWGQAKDADAATDMKDCIMMATDPSPWKSEWYMLVTKEVPGANNIKLSGTFMTKVFDGPYNDVPRYMKEMDAYLAGKGKKSIKYYFHYASCSKCAKKYGHNYIVAFAQVE